MSFNQDKFEKLLVEWSAEKNLPFNFFDDDKSESIFEYINDKVKLPKRNKMKSLFLSYFEETQEIILEILHNNTSKISYTIDRWSAINGRSYYGVTGHFIDNDWILRSLVIDFLPSNGKHTGQDIANLFLGLLKEKGLTDKLQAVTVDNAAANTTFFKKLTNLMNTLFGTHFDPNDLHFRCFAHIINLAAQDMLRELEVDDSFAESEDGDDGETLEDYEHPEEIQVTSKSKIIVRLRALFKKLKYSEQLREKLESVCNVMGEKMLSPILDVSTRWNSAYDMMNAAILMRLPLEFLCSSDASLKTFSLTPSEWLLLTNVKNHLKFFKTLSTTLCGEKFITLPLVVLGLNMLLDKLEKAIVTLDENRRLISSELQLRNALQSALDKLLKHYRKCNWIYSAILILDPRHKYETFEKTEWGREIASSSAEKFETSPIRLMYFGVFS